tara:strand:+ start:438 stop:2660 length:2223 start_codon:yes stop_codon:yes gene_type:complete
MDRNLKILMIFLILLFLYDLLCGKNVEGFTKKNFVYYSESQPGPNYTPTPNLMDNASVNSFTYENPSYDGLDIINTGNDYTFFWDTRFNNASNREVACKIRYPNWKDDPDRYNTGENGSLVNLYNKCLSEDLTYKKSVCISKEDTSRGTINGSNAHQAYYMWDTFPDKNASGMCTYTPPSMLTTGQYCSVYTDVDTCNAHQTVSGENQSGENHCTWIPSIRSEPFPTMDHARLCFDINKGEENNADKNECENASINGFRPCKFTENTLIVKASDKDGKESGSIDVSGTCEIDFNNYVGGLNLDEIRFYSANGDVTVDKVNGSLIVSSDSVDDKSNLYRYINSGKCMENCSVSSSSVCNNRYSCVWVDEIIPAEIDTELGNRLNGPEFEGKCMNKEIYFNMKDEDDPTQLAPIYDHTQICNHHKTEQICNSGSDSPDAPSRLYDDSWHCKWKHYLGICDQIGVKQIKEDPTNPDKVTDVEFTSQNGSYTTTPDALSCQTIMAKHIIEQMDPDDAKNPIKQFEYMADPANASELKEFCNNYRYESASLIDASGYDSSSTASGTQFCLWKPPRKPECAYKGGPDLVNPGGYFNKNNQPFGKFTYQEPAFYFNNNFPPMCSLLKNGSEVSASDCENASRNCSWTNGKCLPRCIRVGSNNNICEKTVDEQYNQAVAHNKTSRIPDPMLEEDADDDTIKKVKKRFDDYSHCKFNEELNTCVLQDDYDKWKNNNGPWSSEIETQKWT